MKKINTLSIARGAARIAKKLGEVTCSAVILAGGNSTRMGGRSKQLISIHGVPVIVHSALAFEKCPQISEIIIVCRSNEKQLIESLMKKHGISKFKGTAPGGSTRFDSCRNGFEATDKKADLVAIHDGARCMITPENITEVINAAARSGAAIAACPSTDTVKIIKENGKIEKTVDRNTVWQAQTPQIFLRNLLEVGLYAEREKGFVPTDDAMLVETLGFEVTPVNCGKNNMKITFEEDVPLAEAILKKDDDNMKNRFKIGHGYDVHKLVEGRKLILGGVEIPYSLGLLGHSDADVLSHAVADAILGAIGERDIGYHFPDNDPRYEGISSLVLLEKVAVLVSQHDAEISNIDATVVLQEPHVSKYIESMAVNIARALGIAVEDVNIKATTEEKLGFTGSGEGVAAHAVCSVYCK